MAMRNLSGWRRQPYDPRDIQHVVPRRLLATLPDYYDLSPGMGNQLDQGSLGSCGPFTADECITFDQKTEGLSPTGAAPLFTYYCTRSLMGTVGEDSGVDNRTMLRALAGYGFVPEALYPYDTSKFKQKPPQSVIDAAAKNKITSYAAVAKTADMVKGTLAGGRPFLLGFDVFEQMMGSECARTGIVALPSGTSIGGHDVSAVGYTLVERPGVEPGKRWPANTVKFRNHWVEDNGRPWGDGGYGYLPLDYVLGAHADDFWVITAVPGAVPTPPAPVPPPVPVPPSPLPPPEPAPMNYVLTGTVKIPLLGNAPMTGTLAPASKLDAPASLSVPPELWALLFKYGRAVLPIVIADVLAKKSGKQIIADILAAVAAGQLAA